MTSGLFSFDLGYYFDMFSLAKVLEEKVLLLLYGAFDIEGQVILTCVNLSILISHIEKYVTPLVRRVAPFAILFFFIGL